jgi:hypothetical protein
MISQLRLTREVKLKIRRKIKNRIIRQRQVEFEFI